MGFLNKKATRCFFTGAAIPSLQSNRPSRLLACRRKKELLGAAVVASVVGRFAVQKRMQKDDNE